MESITPRPMLADAEHQAWINARVSADQSLTRYRLAREVCVRLDLRDANGRPREMACRKQLLALERRGQIELPPPRHKPPSRRPPAREPSRGLSMEPAVWPEFTGPLAGLGRVSLCPVTGGATASRAWN